MDTEAEVNAKAERRGFFNTKGRRGGGADFFTRRHEAHEAEAHDRTMCSRIIEGTASARCVSPALRFF